MSREDIIRMAREARMPYFYQTKEIANLDGLERFANLVVAAEPVAWTRREWAGLMLGVRVKGDTVVISVKGGNDAARHLCGELLKEKHT